jgi:hypothetical protein
MATHGLQVYNSSQTLIYSSADVTWNQVDFFLVNGNSTASNTYPVLIGKEILVQQILVDSPPVDRKAIAHTITTNNTNGTVSVGGGSERAYILVLMR